jgi:NodT family efflux transporter outer membrane factor (OMF) lipoprotein
MKTGALLMTVLLLAAGCASSPDVRHPRLGVEIPAGWEGQAPGSDSVLSDAWVLSFQDTGLSRAVAEALTGNYDLQAVAARIDGAAAQARIAGADLPPNLSLVLSGSRRKQNFIGLPIPGERGDVLSTTTNNFGASLNLSWEVDLWGRVRSAKSAAMADLEAAAADYDGARLSLAAQTAKAWFAAVEAREQVGLSAATVESYRRTADEVQERYERGLRSPLDLRLALANQASAEALLSLRQRQLDGAHRQLEILLGRYPTASMRLADSLAAVPPPAPAGLPAQLVSRRPDLIAAERRLAAADERVSEARASLYPRLSLTGSAGTSSRELEDILNQDFSVWSLAGNILQPLFQGGRLRAGIDLSKANMRQAWAAYGSALLHAFSEVESALAAEEFLREREQRLAEATRQSQAAELLAAEQYREGLIDLITLLDSQRRALNARSQLLTVRRERLDARIDLHLALGGSFTAVDTAQPASADEREGSS